MFVIIIFYMYNDNFYFGKYMITSSFDYYREILLPSVSICSIK